jgi:endonuclease YncB( thermonuclease family)
MSQSCRLYGIDTPESSTKAGKLVKEILKQKIDSFPKKSLTCKSIGLDKYANRFIGQVWAENFCINDWLIEIGVGKPYLGKKKEVWAEAELQNICDICENILAKNL